MCEESGLKKPESALAEVSRQATEAGKKKRLRAVLMQNADLASMGDITASKIYRKPTNSNAGLVPSVHFSHITKPNGLVVNKASPPSLSLVV